MEWSGDAGNDRSRDRVSQDLRSTSPRRPPASEAGHPEKQAGGFRRPLHPPPHGPRAARPVEPFYSTVTDLARLRGWSTFNPRFAAM